MLDYIFKYLLLIGFAITLILCAELYDPAESKYPYVPDSALTPGDTLSVSLDVMCKSGYTKTVRNVPESLKKKVFKLYKLNPPKPSDYEIDHLINLGIGGSNDIKNLWPQPYGKLRWSARVKDKLENEVRRRVCNKELNLKIAQHKISENWIRFYKEIFNDQVYIQGE